MSSDSHRVLVAGTINTDLVVRVRRAPDAGETVTGRSFDMYGGGKGANQAVAAARAGAQVAMLSGVGRDDFGERRRADLAEEGIDTHSVITTDRAASGVALIIVEDSGQNRIAYVPGAGWDVGPADARAALESWRPSIVLSTLELRADTLDALFEASRSQGVRIICNATPEPSAVRDLAARADMLIVNEQEAVELADVDPVAGWEPVARRLGELGPETVVITLGSEGALVLDRGRIERIGAPSVEVVDTTGAGDAFCGAFAAMTAAGERPVEAARWAVCAGAVAVSRAGAQPSMPNLAEIRSLRQTQDRA